MKLKQSVYYITLHITIAQKCKLPIPKNCALKNFHWFYLLYLRCIQILREVDILPPTFFYELFEHPLPPCHDEALNHVSEIRLHIKKELDTVNQCKLCIRVATFFSMDQENWRSFKNRYIERAPEIGGVRLLVRIFTKHSLTSIRMSVPLRGGTGNRLLLRAELNTGIGDMPF